MRRRRSDTSKGERRERSRKPRHDKSRGSAPQSFDWEWPSHVGIAELAGSYRLVRLSFMLCVPDSEKGKDIALAFANKMGLDEARIDSTEAIGDALTKFNLTARCDTEIVLDEVVPPASQEETFPDFDSINRRLRDSLDRKPLVIGAYLGPDTRNFIIDTLFNRKGYLDHPGLERYPSLKAINLRSQTDATLLAQRLTEMQVDAVIVAPSPSPGDEDPVNILKRFIEALKNLPENTASFIKICCGPRLNHETAKELGFDAGFGPGTSPAVLADYLATELITRRNAAAA